MPEAVPTRLDPPGDEPIFVRRDNSIVFNQLGLKLQLDPELDPERYFVWLDDMTVRIGELVPGAQIVEKDYARTSPRVNTGVYYDTPDRQLASLGAVLRTTCNRITHAFCAFKEPVDAAGVRRDHRHVFDGQEKRTLQEDPLSESSIAMVKRLLARTDIAQPGGYLRERFGIDPDNLTPSVLIRQQRCPFFVWLDGRDSLRCVMDRVRTSDLRARSPEQTEIAFSELELPVYPRIEPEVARDPRTVRLMDVLSSAAQEELSAVPTLLNKYQRAVGLLGLVEIQTSTAVN